MKNPDHPANWTESEVADTYRRWLLECVFERGWTTLKCANMLKADPDEVRMDFERFASELSG